MIRRTVIRSAFHRRWLAAFQLLLFLSLVWLSADQRAHAWLHSLPSPLSPATYQTEDEDGRTLPNSGGLPTDQTNDDADCVITWLQQGQLNETAPPSVVATLDSIPALVAVSYYSALAADQPVDRLPFSCGPPPRKLTN